MDNIREKIDHVAKLGLTDLLKANGFKKAGRRWSKQVEEDWFLVGLQASTSNYGSTGKFVVNIGVYNTELEKIIKRFHYREGKIPNAEGSTSQCRLGELAYGRGHWWEIDQDTDLQNLSNDIVEKMTLLGLPWLEKNNDLQALADRVKNELGVYTIALQLVLGKRQEAANQFQRLLEKRPQDNEALRAWAEKAGLKT